METLEEWKTINRFPDYEVSDQGRARSKDKVLTKMINVTVCTFDYPGRILKSRATNTGYIYYSFRINGKTISATIHRLVAMAFVPNPENKPDVNHCDSNKENNMADNLEWVTKQENHDHKVSMNRQSRGTDVPSSKLTEDSVLEIRELLAMGVNQTRIAEKFGVVGSCITNIKQRKTWRHVE